MISYSVVDRTLFDALPSAAIVDEHGVILDTNRAWHLFGRANGAIADTVGINYLGVCEGAYGECAEGALEAAAGIRAVIRGEQEQFNLEYPCHSPTQKRWYNMRVTYFHEAARKLILIVHQDITHWKLTEEALVSSESRYRVLAENITDIITRHSPDGNYLYVSPASERLLGYVADTLLARTPYDFVHPADVSTVQNSHSKVLDRTDADTITYRVRHQDGHYVWVETTARTLFDLKTGYPTEIICVTRDVTARKQAEEALRLAHDELEERVEERTAELRAANEEVRRFAYIVSHDLRGPLINIQGFVSELRESLKLIQQVTEKSLQHLDEGERVTVQTALEQDIPEAFDFIHSAVDRMDHFINAILRLSRLGRRELNPEKLDLEEVLDAVLKSLAHQIVERRASITLGAMPTVMADRTALEQILGNILTNAIVYLDPHRPGEIEVCCETTDRETIFHISDNGRGIAEQDFHKVFEPFRRAGKPDVPGEGMGLSYVQTLVRRHGGRIWFESQLGVGTTFSFTIKHE